MSGTPAKHERFAVQVVFHSGDIAYLRHGADIGEGPIVQCRTRRHAETLRENMRLGFDADEVQAINIVRYRDVQETRRS